MSSAIYQKLRTIRHLFYNSISFDRDTAIDIVEAVMLRGWGNNGNMDEHNKEISEFIDDFLCLSFGIKAEELYIENSSRKYSYPRLIAMSMHYLFTSKPAGYIAHSFNKKNHSSVKYSRMRMTDMVIANWQPESPIIMMLYEELERKADEIGLNIFPDWYQERDAVSRLVKLTKTGPFHREHCALVWMRETLNSKKGKRNVIRQAKIDKHEVLG